MLYLFLYTNLDYITDSTGRDVALLKSINAPGNELSHVPGSSGSSTAVT